MRSEPILAARLLGAVLAIAFGIVAPLDAGTLAAADGGPHHNTGGAWSQMPDDAAVSPPSAVAWGHFQAIATRL